MLQTEKEYKALERIAFAKGYVKDTIISWNYGGGYRENVKIIKLYNANGMKGVAAEVETESSEISNVPVFFDGKWAKIISQAHVKETDPMETFPISRLQLKFIHSRLNDTGKGQLEEWYPKVIDNYKDFTGWLKSKHPISKSIEYYDKGVLKYGFDSDGNWFNADDHSYSIRVIIGIGRTPAAAEEIEESLKQEAIKRGFGSIGVSFFDWGNVETSNIEGFRFWNKRLSLSDRNRFNISVSTNCGVIYRNDIWSEIVPTITAKEAEAKLGHKFKIIN